MDKIPSRKHGDFSSVESEVMKMENVSDFWKEKIVLIQRQNLLLGKPVENILEAQKKIACLEQKFPACRFETEKTENSLSVLVNVSSYFQVRLFIQKQTKLSFFEKSSSGFEKIADAKLPSEPFSQLEHFIQHFPEYEVEFSRLSEKCALQDKKMKIAGEFLKAILGKKYSSGKTIFSIQIEKESFKVMLKTQNSEKCFFISPEEIPDLEFKLQDD